MLRGLTFSVRQGEILCVLGGNGSGKSTMLSVTSGWLTPYAGTVRVCGKRLREYGSDSLFRNCLAYLPQDVTTLFACQTAEEELAEVGISVPDTLMAAAHTHPYDLSGGQKQLLALTKVLATHPRLLLLDEPTKGLDSTARERIAKTLRELRESGLTIVCVTHDVDFAAAIAERCGFFFRGEEHSMLELTYVDNGSIHSVAGGQDLVLTQGDMAIYGPNQLHMQYADPDCAPSYITITFDLEGDSLERLLNRKFRTPQKAVLLLQQMQRERDREDRYTGDMLISLLGQLLLTVLREAEGSARLPLRTANAINNENEVVGHAQRFIGQNVRMKEPFR